MVDFVLTALTFIIPFALVLGLVVTIHELGHFLQPLKAVVEVAKEEGAPKWLDRRVEQTTRPAMQCA